MPSILRGQAPGLPTQVKTFFNSPRVGMGGFFFQCAPGTTRQNATDTQTLSSMANACSVDMSVRKKRDKKKMTKPDFAQTKILFENTHDKAVSHARNVSYHCVLSKFCQNKIANECHVINRECSIEMRRNHSRSNANIIPSNYEGNQTSDIQELMSSD